LFQLFEHLHFFERKYSTQSLYGTTGRRPDLTALSYGHIICWLNIPPSATATITLPFSCHVSNRCITRRLALQPPWHGQFSLFGWLVADGWCWFVLREEYCWLVAGGWFVVREKYCWLVADKPGEQGE
jgi:hypothetical protein